eukprot:11104657-Alexandrium_andersonii.AAC.1
MSASLVGSEMCIRDRPSPFLRVPCLRGTIALRATTGLRKARALRAKRSALSARQHAARPFGPQRSPSQRAQHGRSS